MRLSKINFGIISLLFAIILMGCNNSVESKVEEVASDYTQLYITIESSSRTIMPEQISLDGLSFKLLGAKSGAPLSEVKTWNNKNEISSSAISIKPGEWNFTLNAYAAGNLVLTCSKQNVFIQDSANFIHFNLDEPSDLLGSVDITFDFPVGSGYVPSAKKIIAKLVKDSDSEIEVDSQVLIPETYANDSTKQFVRYQNVNVEEGYYFLRFYIYQLDDVDYTNFHSTYVRVEPGLKSKSSENILSLAKEYTITFNLNGGTWGDNVIVPIKYSSFETLDLPLNVTFESDYWSNARFDGWYEKEDNGDYSESKVIKQLEIGAEGNKTLFAKWSIYVDEDKIIPAFEYLPNGFFTIVLTSISVTVPDLWNEASENICLNNPNKYVILFLGSGMPTFYQNVSSYNENTHRYGTCVWYKNYEGSSSIIEVDMPLICYNTNTYHNHNNNYPVYYLSPHTFTNCENLKIIRFYEKKKDVSPYWYDLTGNSYSSLTGSVWNSYAKGGCFAPGIKVICNDGEFISSERN